MSGRYDDIIRLPHHVSQSRKQMSLADRAAQFSPFAALTGYDAAICEAGRLTDSQVDFAADGKEILDEKLRCLSRRVEERPEVILTHFVPDARKTGGAYVNTAGRVKKIDAYQKMILMEDGTEISFDFLFDIV